MKIQRRVLLLILISFAIQFTCHQAEIPSDMEKNLKVHFAGDARIEVGGPFAGVEFHHSSVLPQRISLFYPVANSIDASMDYWNRDTTFVMAIGLKVGNEAKQWLGSRPWEFELTPYAVAFQKQSQNYSLGISYRFCKTKPALVISYHLTHTAADTTQYELETHLETALRTSHSYRKKEVARTEYDSALAALYTYFADPETGNATIFVGNVGEKPVAFNGVGPLNRRVLFGDDWWQGHAGKLFSGKEEGYPAARFRYLKKLAPGQELKIVQVVGSSRKGEARDILEYLSSQYDKEVQQYEEEVLQATVQPGITQTNQPELDHSLRWAKAILKANAHYLDGEIVPMPCPAEYNFYFTHDALVTDLAAVIFDLQRVKRDLQFIIDHANADGNIPHAYYWKDTAYVTEYAGTDNWNNFWFIIAAASYLRHSADSAFVRSVYPFIEHCLHNGLQTRQEDHLIWSNRPDWWDIGKNFGPRAYMTILAIKAIRDYVFLSTMLALNLEKLTEWEEMANQMQWQLNSELWDDNQQYFINYYEDGQKDAHYYIGPLLAVHFNLTEHHRKAALVQSAQSKLLDENLGIYNAFPMDFALLGDYFKFSGNEAGAPHYYFNGGIWPQGNAWYALALMGINQPEEALRFIKNTMTLQGVMRGPNGQPAMYEVRNSNRNNPREYGTVDKPQFLWAAGWYIYSLYHLLLLDEDAWNIRLNPFIPPDQNSHRLSLFVGGKLLEVHSQGKGHPISQIEFDGKNYPAAILPLPMPEVSEIKIRLGKLVYPYFLKSRSILVSARYDPSTKILSGTFKAFPGHLNTVKVLSPRIPKAVYVNENPLSKKNWNVQEKGEGYLICIHVVHQLTQEKLSLEF
ncbi:MAG: hypothetical protein Kow0042_17740 [Calditrichia bacterium]